MIWVEVVFWVCVVLTVYTYVGYAALLLVLPKRRAAESATDEYNPQVTLIIAAYNEEAFIGEKIENSLSIIDSHFDFKVVVVSDGSEDETNKIVGGFSDSRLTFIPLHKRGGKANALNRALEVVGGDYVVFTDANVFLESNAISKLLQRFADPNVGAVTGLVELEALESSEPLGEGAYMKYERLIQQLESSFWSVAGVDGALFAARRSLVSTIPGDTVLDDFLIGTNVALDGKRIVYEPLARAVEQVPAKVAQEFRRKTRIAAGCFQYLARLELRSFFTSPMRFQFAFISHKVIRWYVPFLLVGALFTNLFLWDEVVYRFTLYGQLLLYALASVAHFVHSLRTVSVFYVPYYFVAMNAAMFVGWVRHKRSAQTVTWRRVDR